VKDRKLDVNAAEAKVGWALPSALAKEVVVTDVCDETLFFFFFLPLSVKVRKYDMWRKSGFQNVRSEDVRPELATGKAELLEDNDVVRFVVAVPFACG